MSSERARARPARPSCSGSMMRGCATIYTHKVHAATANTTYQLCRIYVCLYGVGYFGSAGISPSAPRCKDKDNACVRIYLSRVGKNDMNECRLVLNCCTHNMSRGNERSKCNRSDVAVDVEMIDGVYIYI